MIFKFTEYIKETCDNLITDTGEVVPYDSHTAIPFFYYKGKLILGGWGSSHGTMGTDLTHELGFNVGEFTHTGDDAIWSDKIWDNVYYQGRLYTEQKIISFWAYPEKNKFDSIIYDLEKELDMHIFNEGYRVEISKTSYSGRVNYDHPDYEKFEVEELEMSDRECVKFIPVEWYSGKEREFPKKTKSLEYRQMLYGEKIISKFDEFLLEKTSLLRLGIPRDVVTFIEKDFQLDPNTPWKSIKLKKDVLDLLNTQDEVLMVELDPHKIKVFTKYHHRYYIDRYKYDIEGWGTWDKGERVAVSKTEFINEIDYKNLKFYTLHRFKVDSFNQRELNRRINEIEVFRFHFKLEFREKFNRILKKMYGLNSSKIMNEIVKNLSMVSTLNLSPEEIKDILEQNIEQSKKVEYLKIKATDEDPKKLKSEIPQPNSLTIFDEYLLEYEDAISTREDEFLNIKEICDKYGIDKVMLGFMYFLYSNKLMEL